MENTGKLLFEESLKFLEICQCSYFSGKIDFGMYLSLSKVKIEFIELMIKKYRQHFIKSDEVKERLEAVRSNDYIIFQQYKKSSLKLVL